MTPQESDQLLLAALRRFPNGNGTRALPIYWDLPTSEAFCRQLATTHYENFPLVARLLPAELRQPFFNVYAYCRWSDDLGDELRDRDLSTRLLRWWRGELARCWAGGEMAHPVFVALQRTVRDFDLDRQPFDDLLTAFEQDQVVTQYDTFEELLGYCRNSANPVGKIVLRLCGCDDERSVELSDSVCTGLQLANFWQDVARDAEIGRTYLPREDCERFGYSRHDWEQRVTNAAFLELMKFEVHRAREFLLAVRELAPRLRGRLQVAIELFGEGGLKICDRIEAIGFRVWDRRPVVTKLDAVGLLLKCLGRALCRKVAA
jgi:squalene synthase HpnC